MSMELLLRLVLRGRVGPYLEAVAILVVRESTSDTMYLDAFTVFCDRIRSEDTSP